MKELQFIGTLMPSHPDLQPIVSLLIDWEIASLITFARNDGFEIKTPRQNRGVYY
jgi:hypothetical protein